ncbi:MAG: hypothetical protein QW579_03850 [Desulfurococcaceae archaeon]
MMDQFLALTIIGVAILIIGFVLYIVKIRGAGLLILLGALWLFTMALYYGLSYAGIYGETHIVNNLIGVLILVVGSLATLQYLKKAKKPQAR